MQKEKVKPQSRRTFLKRSGILATGAALTIGGVNVVSGSTKGNHNGTNTLPWSYKKLDVEMARKLGHLGYYKGECGAGTFYGILWPLREKIGHPYDSFPIEPPNIMSFGVSGVVGWASLCGALNGASAAITLITKNYKPIINELFGWYQDASFPSDQSNEYASKHQFLVKKYKSDKILAKSVAKSPLCHVSVTHWCKASNLPSGSKERSERCARVAGDVAARTVELLNMYAEGKFKPTYAFSAEVAGCRQCHFKGKDFEAGQFTRGKMDCTLCHEPHKI